MNYHVEAFIDNDCNKWDKMIDGIRIFNPEEARNKNHNTRYIVANNLYSQNMKSQLLQYGITEEHICIF